MRFYDEIRSIGQQIRFDGKFVPEGKYENIVICGMGGSAIAGMVFGDIYKGMPVTVTNDYRIPDYVGENTLFFAVSHSGNTEETLSGLDQAIAKKAKTFIISSGGKISRYPGNRITIPGDFQPRSSIGFMLMPLLRTFNMVDDSVLHETEIAIDRTFGMEDEIAEIASGIVKGKKMPVIYGLPPSPSLAYRWKTQFNENSKILAHSSVLPEMNHNELAAIPHAFQKDRFEFFVSGTPRGRYLDRLRITEEITGCSYHRPPEISSGTVPEIFSSIVYGDLISYHVAEARGIDPRDVSAITSLKESLARL